MNIHLINYTALKKLYLLLLVVLCGAVISPAMAKKKNKKKASTETTEKKDKKKETKYDELFKNKKVTVAKGFITLHKFDNKIYFEMPLKVLNRDILLGSTIAETTDNQFGCVGEKSGDPFLIRFVQRDSTITLRRVQAGQFSNDPDISKRLVSSTMPAIVETFEIKAYNNDSTAVVFDMTEYLLSDKKNLSPFSPYSMFEAMGANVDSDFEKDNSFITAIKAFEDNISVRSSMTYKVSVGAGGSYAVKKMPFTAVMNRSFILLPEQPMRPRYADPRIGVFEHEIVEFSSEGRGLKTRHITHRWNLEPSDEAAYRRGELVEPKKPIVYYIDDAFPASWKKYIHQGVEVWQKAFEKIGFKNAIIARDFPKDDPTFDPENIKYSCIRYAPSPVANAMGPSWIDPRSGEIINASVTVFHNIVQLVQYWRFLQTAPADKEVRGLTLRDDLLGDCIAYVLSHEVGHTLALMHNMAGSSSIPVESLRDPKFTQKYGTTYSIMDYARNNYVAQPGDKEKGVRLTPPELGVYDYYAISWLYSPILDAKTAEEEIPTLDRWISEKSGDPKYRYGKQQFRKRFDPSSVEEDLGDDPVKASEYGRRNLQYLLKHMNEWVAGKDKDFEFRKAIYDEIVYAYVRYMSFVLSDIGGIYLNERYDGDKRPSYATVPKAQQKKALKFMLDEMKNLSWLDARDLMREFPIRNNVSVQMEDAIMDGILSRTGAIALCASKSTSNPYTQEEYLADIERAVWAPTYAGKSLSEMEMRLQMNFLTKLIEGSVATVAKNATRKGITDAYTGIAVPEWLKAASRERFGIVSEEYMGVFNNKPAEMQASNLREISGFDEEVSLKAPIQPMDHIYYGELKKIRSLLSGKVSTGSADTQRHYRLLIYKIDQALK